MELWHHYQKSCWDEKIVSVNLLHLIKSPPTMCWRLIVLINATYYYYVDRHPFSQY